MRNTQNLNHSRKSMLRGLVSSVLLVVVCATTTQAQSRFVRGDCNVDTRLDLSDPVSVLTFLFLGEEPPLSSSVKNRPSLPR